MPTIVNTLYPPVMPTFAPAFVNTTDVRVYYSLSPYNEYTKIQRVHIAIINQKNNETALNNINGIITQELKYDTVKGMYYITISPQDIKGGFGINQYYKVQVRFDTYEGGVPSDPAEFNAYLLENLVYFSEWSSICLIKPILQPSLLLRTWDNDTTLAFNKGIIPISGKVYFGDGNNNETEVLQSFKVEILDGDDVVLSTPSIYTGTQVNPNDINYKIDLQGLDTSITIEFTMRITITTSNQYVMSKEYEFQIAEYMEDKAFNPTITVEVDNEDGIAHLRIENNLTVFGMLHVKRGSSIDNFKTWEDIKVVHIAGPIEMDIYDNTIGSLVWYSYSVQLENSKGVLTQVFRSEKFIPDFYDVILSRGEQQLKIRFDYKLSGMKPTVNRTKFDTLGGRYPKFAENGILNYKTFSISGTLSAMMDDNHHFLKRSDYFGPEYQNYLIYNQENYNGSSIGYKSEDYNLFINEEAYNYNDHFWEREFREEVIKWLNDGEPKLYRSMAEGNMAVMLTDISLSPNDVLSRRIWTVTATVYEIAEGTSLDILDELGIYEVENMQDIDGGTIDPVDPEEYVLVSKPGQLYQFNVPLEKNDVTSNVILADITTKYAGVLQDKRPDEIYLKSVKLFFQNEPHPFIYRNNAGWLLAENLSWNQLTDTEKASLQLGYTFEIRSTESEGYSQFFVNERGYYQIPDYINVKEISFPQNNDIVTMEYIVVYKEKNKSNSIVSGTTVEKTLIGQEMGVFQPNEYLGERIRSKYTFLKEDDYTQRMQFWKGISLDVTPFAVAHILYHGDTEYKDYLVGMTGVLHMLKSYKVDNICFKGIKMNKMPKKRQPYLKNYEFVMNNDTAYPDTDSVGMPKLNTVYPIGNGYKIYYQYQWYDFEMAENDTGIAVVPVEGAINYIGDIVRVSIA